MDYVAASRHMNPYRCAELIKAFRPPTSIHDRGRTALGCTQALVAGLFAEGISR